MPCDLCIGSIDTGSTRHTCSKFRAAVRAGLRPPPGIFAISTAMGVSQEQAQAGWVQQVMSDSTDWVLCADCTQRTKQYFSALALDGGSRVPSTAPSDPPSGMTTTPSNYLARTGLALAIATGVFAILALASKGNESLFFINGIAFIFGGLGMIVTPFVCLGGLVSIGGKRPALIGLVIFAIALACFAFAMPAGFAR
jgi:hypothetical protein